MITIIQSKGLNSSIWPIDGILTGITNQGQSGPRSMLMKGYSTFSEAPGLEFGLYFMAYQLLQVI